MDPLSSMQRSKAGNTSEEAESEEVWSDLYALKKLYGLLQVKGDTPQRASNSENLDEKSRFLLKKLLDGATEQTFQRHAKIIAEQLVASPLPDDSAPPEKFPDVPAPNEVNTCPNDVKITGEDCNSNAIKLLEKGQGHCPEGTPAMTPRSKKLKISRMESKKGQQVQKDNLKHQTSVKGYKTSNDKLQKTKNDSNSQGHLHSHKHNHRHHYKNLGISDSSSKAGQKKESESKQAKESENKKRLREKSINQNCQNQGTISLLPRSMSSQTVRVRSMELNHELGNEKERTPEKTNRIPEKPELPSQKKRIKGHPHQASELSTMTLQLNKLSIKKTNLPSQSTTRRKRSGQEKKMDEAVQKVRSVDDGEMTRTVRLGTQVLTRIVGRTQKRDHRSQSGGPSETDQMLSHQIGKFSVEGSGLIRQMRCHKCGKSKKRNFEDEKLTPSSNTDTNNNGIKIPSNPLPASPTPGNGAVTANQHRPRNELGPSDQDRMLSRTRNSSPKHRSRQPMSQNVNRSQDHSPYKLSVSQTNQSRRRIKGLKHQKHLVVSQQKKHLLRQKMTNSKLLQETSTTESSSPSSTSLPYSMPSQQTSSENSEDTLSDRMMTRHAVGPVLHRHRALVSRRRDLLTRERRMTHRQSLREESPPRRILSHHAAVRSLASPKAEHVKKSESKIEGLRRLKNKLAIIFHHHHYHHVHDGDNYDDDGHAALPDRRHRSFWNYLPRILHRTRKDDNGKFAAEVYRERAAEGLRRPAVSIAPPRHQHGHLHAVIDGLLRHVWHSRKRDATAAAAAGRRPLQKGKTGNLLRVKKLHWWQRFHKSGGVKLRNRRRLGFRRSHLRPAKKK